MTPGWSVPRRVAVPAVAVLVTLTVMEVHTLARDHRWRFEWRWATYQYHFGLVLLAPVLCGLGAWIGGRATTLAWLTRTAGRPVVALRPVVVAVAASCTAYVLGWIVPAAVVVASGSSDVLSPSTVATFGPALAVVVAFVVVGFATGARWPGRLVPPATAITAFAVTMAGWMAGAERLVRFGGAGMTMVSLRPTGLIQIAQAGLYTVVALAALVTAAGRLAGGSDLSRAVGPLVVVAVSICGWLVVTSSPMFDHPRASDVCLSRSGVVICAPAPYDRSLQGLAGSLAPALGRMRAAGAPIGERVRIGAMVGLFEPSPPPEVLAGELFDALGLGQCWTPDTGDDLAGLSLWIRTMVGDPSAVRDMSDDPAVPTALRGHDPLSQDEWAAAAIDRVRATCPVGG